MPSSQQKREERSFGLIPFRQANGQREFLLIQHNAGHWAFPKGRPEAGESAIESATREFEEETGIHEYQLLDPDRPFVESYEFVRRGQHTHKEVVYYLALVAPKANVTVQVEEVQDFTWLSAEATSEKITFPASTAMFREVLKSLEN